MYRRPRASSPTGAAHASAGAHRAAPASSSVVHDSSCGTRVRRRPAKNAAPRRGRRRGSGWAQTRTGSSSKERASICARAGASAAVARRVIAADPTFGVAMSLTDDVRAHAARTAATARSVRIDLDALGALDPGPEPEMDPVRHYLEGSEADVAAYVLVLDTVNFGSGWFPTLRKRAGSSGYFTVSWALADRWRAHGPWTNAQLRAIRADEIADVLGQPRDHELMALFAQALRQLGAWLGERAPIDVARTPSAVGLASLLAGGMTMYADRGFYKRAQIVPHDLALAGVAAYPDLDDLTIFADNLVPHVLRDDGVLRYDAPLARHIDAGRRLRPGPQEREIRACAVHACEVAKERLGMTARDIDHALWHKGQGEAYKARPRHRCRTVFY